MKHSTLFLLATLLAALMIGGILLVPGVPPSLQTAMIAAAVSLVVTMATGSLQLRSLEFQRMGARPELRILHDKICLDRAICLRNEDTKVVSGIYLGCFLIGTADGGEPVLLNDDIEAPLGPGEEIAQSDILRPPYRDPFAEYDRKKYGATLRERWTNFAKQGHGIYYLAVVARTSTMNPEEAHYGFYQAVSPIIPEQFPDSFSHVHIPSTGQTFQAVAKFADKRFKKLRN